MFIPISRIDLADNKIKASVFRLGSGTIKVKVYPTYNILKCEIGLPEKLLSSSKTEDFLMVLL